jgi:hypothetical protein
MSFIVGLRVQYGIRVMHISLRVIILTYRSLYGGAHVAQTSGGGALTDTQ